MTEQRDDRGGTEESTADAANPGAATADATPATTDEQADSVAVGDEGDSTAVDDSRGSATADGTAGSEATGNTDRGSRDVVVPMPLYKTVTVFSTLLAVVGVVGGFVLLDAAVMSGGVVRVVVDALLGIGGVRISPDVWASLQPVFAVGGLAAIALGAVVYVLGSRFRAEGMGRDDDGNDE